MHDFQPYPIDLLDINPFTKYNKDWGIVVSEAQGQANAMTISWGGMGTMWGKDIVNVYIRESRYTKELIDDSDYFSVCFFEDPKMHSVMGYLGKASGRSEDKLATAGLNVGHRGEIPYVDEAKLIFLCKKLSATPMPAETFIDEEISTKWYPDGDYHTMYIGEVVEVLAR